MNTPGEWIVDPEDSLQVIVKPKPGVDDIMVGQAYCENSEGCDSETSQADALLFAAAKDLLAGCKAALGAFESNHAINWDDLRRAIDKAEGPA